MASSNRYLLLVFLVLPFLVKAQYTDVINSNRPGIAVSAYAVGTNVIQAETGFLYEKRNHSTLNTDASRFGGELALRYGLLFEQLEVIYEGTFLKETYQKVLF